MPQVLRVWRTRSTRDISLRMFLVLVTGLSLWLTYGVTKGEPPIVIANSITLTLAGTILFFKLRHRDQSQPRLRPDRHRRLAEAVRPDTRTDDTSGTCEIVPTMVFFL